MSFRIIKVQALAALIVALCAVSSVSQAQIITEQFSYPAGPLNGDGGWVNHSGTADSLLVLDTPSDSGSSLSFGGFATSAGNRALLNCFGGATEDVNRMFGAVAGGSVYYSALVKCTAAPTGGNSDNYFLHMLGNVNTSGGSTHFNGRLFGIDAGGGAFFFGVRFKGETFVTEATPRNVGQTYLIVVRVIMGAGATDDTAALWVNPTPGGPEPAPTIMTTNNVAADDFPGALFTGLQGICLRQATAGSAAQGTWEIDEVRVGTTFASVTPSGGVMDDPDALVPTVVNFGTAETGTMPTMMMTVQNSASSTMNLDLTSFNFSTGDAGFFSITGGIPATGIAPGASHDITVQFTPGVTPGVRSAVFALASNDSGNPSINVTFNGEGITYTDVANIAAARAMATTMAPWAYVRITGPVTMTTRPDSYGAFGGFRTWPCEDATGGILVVESDTAPIIGPVTGPGSVITGLRGRLEHFSAATPTTIELFLDSTDTEMSGAPLTPQVITAAQLLGPPLDTFESELVQLNAVSLQSDPGANGIWTAGQNYPFMDGTATVVVRFPAGAQSSLVGTPLPALMTPVTLRGIGAEFGGPSGTGQLSPASLDDLSQVDAAHDWALFE